MTDRNDGSTRRSRRCALVTGASAGIGQAFAERLAADGFDLVLVARSRERLDALAQRLSAERGVRVEVLAADLTDAAERGLVERAIAERELDLLVNNAGFGTFGPFAESDPGAEEREIQLNVVAVSRLTRAALPGMVARGAGGIINVSSMAAFSAAAYNATYAATKAFVNSFTEALYEELKGTGVTVQALCPGFTRTEFQDRAGIEVDNVPAAAWMEASDVVDISLAALQSRTLICVPGFSNRALAGFSSVLPRGWSRRLVATLARQMLH